MGIQDSCLRGMLGGVRQVVVVELWSTTRLLRLRAKDLEALGVVDVRLLASRALRAAKDELGVQLPLVRQAELGDDGGPSQVAVLRERKRGRKREQLVSDPLRSLCFATILPIPLIRTCCRLAP